MLLWLESGVGQGSGGDRREVQGLGPKVYGRPGNERSSTAAGGGGAIIARGCRGWGGGVGGAPLYGQGYTAAPAAMTCADTIIDVN